MASDPGDVWVVTQKVRSVLSIVKLMECVGAQLQNSMNYTRERSSHGVSLELRQLYSALLRILIKCDSADSLIERAKRNDKRYLIVVRDFVKRPILHIVGMILLQVAV